MMILAMGAVAFATEPDPEPGTDPEPAPSGYLHSITIKPSSTVTLEHKTLKAYKIMDATYSGTGATQAVSYSIPTAMKSFFDSYFGQEADDSVDPPVPAATASQLAAAAHKSLEQYVTEIMGAWDDDSAEIKKFVNAALAAAKKAGLTPITGTASGENVVFNNLTAGYYIVEDEGSATPISALMLDTVTDKDIEITLKASDNTQKKIKTAGELINEKANELGLGRTVEYEIDQKVPDYTGYDHYFFIINDTMTSGLTFDPDSVKVTIDGNELTKDEDYYLYYQDENNSDDVNAVLGNKTFMVTFEDIMDYPIGKNVVVTYNATININAITGVDPNNNDVSVQYSRNPDKSGEGEKIPGYPASTENHPLGDGPHKYTDSYTTKVSIMKIDGETETALPGVEFTLTGSSKDAVFNAEDVFEVDPTGTYYLLKTGKYTETPPQTAPTLTPTTGSSGWVEIAEGETYNGTDIRVVGGKQYRPYKTTDGDKTHYIIVEPNSGDYVSTTVKYKKSVKTLDEDEGEAETYTVNRTGVTGSDGKLDFSQLGAGTYKLSETGVLDGYNSIPDIEFTVTCTLPDAEDVIAGTETATWAISTNTPGVTFTEDKSDDENLGTFSITILNNKGAELPSTGGIGTTIFYVAGSILVLAAVVLLVTKRRMSAGE